MELVLIRHGEPERHAEAAERMDPRLSERGRREARLVAEYLVAEGFDAIYASPLRRAAETAAPLAEMCGLTVTQREDLAEFDWKAASYVHFEDMGADDPSYTAMMREDLSPWGTTVDEFRAKVTAEVERIVSDHPGQKVAIVAHGGVVNAYIGGLIGASKLLIHHPAYTGIARVMASRSGVRDLVCINETAHLRENRSATDA